MTSNWIDKQVSFYANHSDNTGRPATYRDILLTRFAKDLPALISLKKLDKTRQDYKMLSKPFKAAFLLACATACSLISMP